MTTHGKTPALDDRPLLDALYSRVHLLAVLAAHDVGVYALLGKGSRTLSEICAETGAARRPMQAILSTNVGAKLLELQGDRFALTDVGARYLVHESAGYFGALLELMEAVDSVVSPNALRRILSTDRPPGYEGGGEIFQSHAEHVARAQKFTRTMHCLSADSARAWPESLDLGAFEVLLDVGGGSGIHAIAAAERWSQLRAIVLDIPPVCEVAAETIARHRIAGRVATASSDMWSDPFPAADIHFYSMVFHDWPLDKCRVLAKKSFASLPPGGRILLHEMLYDAGKTGPLAVAALSLSLLFATEGEQYTADELTGVLRDAGFAGIDVIPTFGYWSIVSAEKPR